MATIKKMCDATHFRIEIALRREGAEPTSLTKDSVALADVPAEVAGIMKMAVTLNDAYAAFVLVEPVGNHEILEMMLDEDTRQPGEVLH